MNSGSERGSAIIMLFVAVALFGLISYVFLQGSGGSTSMITSEASKAAGYQSQDCTNAVNMATKRLTARGCGALVSMEPDGTPVVGGPADGSCSIFHPNGGGVKGCGNYTNECMLNLAIGESCNGVIYAGVVNGNRIYAAMNDQGAMSWDNGLTTWTGNIPIANSVTDGMSNTNALLSLTNGAPYKAAQACRALGSKWYLPAPDELHLLYVSRNTGAFMGTFTLSPYSVSVYWASRAHTSTNGYMQVFMDGTRNYGGRYKEYRVRCVRQY